MALGLTQPLTAMGTRRGKGGRCVGMILPTSYADCLKSGGLDLLESSGPVQTCIGIAWRFTCQASGMFSYRHTNVKSHLPLKHFTTAA